MRVRLGLLLLCSTLLSGQEFSPVKDWASVRIRFVRVHGFCACPADYEVDIRDGVMRYTLAGTRGARVSAISREDVQQLIDKFRRADFMSLFTKGNQLLDGNADRFFVSIDGQTNEFADYTMHSSKEVTVLQGLANAVDELVNTAYWVDPEQAMTAMQRVPLAPARRRA